MCGIAGIFNSDGRRIQRSRLKRMTGLLAHRGPDAEGYHVFTAHPGTGASAGLGHRRLSILDLSPDGNQPMFAARRRVAIIFNGEIFNFQSLRDELRERGHNFRTNTDTEVLLGLYLEHGIEMLPRLNGMFAFAIWDRRTGTGFLARDRYGIKPLYYCRNGAEMLFASELRAVLTGLPHTPDVDVEALELLLCMRYIPSPWSIYEGIEKLLSGHFVKFDASGPSIHRWYQVPTHRPPLSPHQSHESLFELLDDSVRLRLISDRPLGCFLSGGLDSSIVAALASRHSANPLETYSVTFPAAPMYDESKYSRLVAKHLGTAHHEFPLSSAMVLDAIPAVLDSQDEPFADSSALPTYLLSREMRREIVVALSGDGADELFAGYRKYQGELLQRAYLSLPQPLRSGLFDRLAATLPESRGSRWLEPFRRLRRFVQGAYPDPAERALRWMMLYGLDAVEEISRRPQIGPRFLAAMLPRLHAAMDPIDDPINRTLHADVNLCLTDQMMPKVDRMSMQFGLEVRTPFLDYRVVELAFRIPGQDKLRLGQGKRILIDTFGSLLPREILDRPKRGFEVPMTNWLRGPLKPVLHDLLGSRAAREQPWIDPAAVLRLFDRHQRRQRDYSALLWTTLTFFWWLRKAQGGSQA